MADKKNKADAVAKAQKQKKQPPIKGPDIYIGGPKPQPDIRDIRSKYTEIRSNVV